MCEEYEVCVSTNNLLMALVLLFCFTLSAEDVDFSRDIRPIFNRKCTSCHGGVKKAGGLSLIYKNLALGKSNNGTVIIPGKPEESLLYQIITNPPKIWDAKKKKHRHLEKMPLEKEPLTEHEVELIRLWIEQGASWEEHWSFEKPQKTVVPKEKSDDWSKNNIDPFILAKLKIKGLSPGKEASKEQLLRRVCLDLTGLPPTPQMYKEFMSDASDNAYEKLVERLLKNPNYGERWAGMWLDLARYSDTKGYEKDGPRSIYRFRDEVIKAFNEDMSYDKFIINQLAGDLVEEQSESTKILTAFHRNTMNNEEGGTDDEEFRIAAVMDRNVTTWEAFMGIPYGCVQCHSHPYDPIEHEEYYRFMAFFNNTVDSDKNDERPTIATPDFYQKQQLAKMRSEIANLHKNIAVVRAAIPRTELELELEELRRQVYTGRSMPITFSSMNCTSGAKLKQSKDASVLLTGSKASKDVFNLKFTPKDKVVAQLKLEALPNKSLPKNGPGLANGNFVLSNLNLKVNRETIPSARYVRVSLNRTGILSLAEVKVIKNGKNIARNKKATQSSADFGGLARYAVDGNDSGDFTLNTVTHTKNESNPWWEVDLKQMQKVDEVVIFNRTGQEARLNGYTLTLLNDQRQIVWQERIAKASMIEKSHRISRSFNVHFTSANATYSQKGFPISGALDMQSDSGWALGSQQGQENSALFSSDFPVSTSNTELELKLSFQSKYPNHILGSFRVITSMQKASKSKKQFQVLQKAYEKGFKGLSELEESSFVDFAARRRPKLKSLIDKLSATKQKLKKFRVTRTPIMQELPPNKRRKSFVFIRGNWENHGAEVGPGTPAIMHDYDSKLPRNRLGLAKWMTSKENPLLARVAVNPFWEQIFGRGVVETLEDFGSQGSKPSHPQLLDNLAVDFMYNHKWSVKSLLRQMVLSATYRQSSVISAEKLEKDPFNVYLSRGSRYRLNSEQIRDQALSVSGLMSAKMFGPSVMPYQPNGIWASVYSGQRWVTSQNGDQYRRALYTYWKRTSPYPSMETFDTPSREVCTVRRIRTNTPLQALVTLNDPVYIECATHFAKMILAEELSFDDRLNFAFQRALSRNIKAAELAPLKKLFNSTRKEFKKSELDSWTLVANAIMNLDEFLSRQ